MMTLDQELEALGIPKPEPRPAPVLVAVDARSEHPAAAQWAKWRDRFALAMDGSFHTVERLEQLLFQNKLQFWPGVNAAIITEIVDYPGERALQAKWQAGDIEEAKAMAPGLEAYGRLMGCTSVLIEGRRAWMRELRRQGYAEWSTTIRKAL